MKGTCDICEAEGVAVVEDICANCWRDHLEDVADEREQTAWEEAEAQRCRDALAKFEVAS